MIPIPKLADVLLSAIDCRHRVATAIQVNGVTESSLSVLAIGKAAPAMLEGAFNTLDQLGVSVQEALGITKLGHSPVASSSDTGSKVVWLEGDHPLPSERSFLVGKELISWLSRQKEPVMVLLSGGASSVVESLLPSEDIERYQSEVSRLLRSGAAIHELNAYRRSVSALKGGRAAMLLGDRLHSVWVISDVLDDDLQVIGSGMFYLPETADMHQIVSSAKVELPQLAGVMEGEGYSVDQIGLFSRVEELMTTVEERIVRLASGEALIGMGECPITVTGEGEGGRCTYLAHRLAPVLSHQSGVGFLALATDGTDGPTPFAGGWVDSESYRSDPDGWHDAQNRFDSATWLAKGNRLLTTGPTGTNINDLYVLWRD
jgi:hydroxypyruvate reductase